MRMAILGAGGHGRVVADLAHLAGYTEIIFFDDAQTEMECVGGHRVVGDSSTLAKMAHEFDSAAVAIGDNYRRSEKLDFCACLGLDLPILVHPRACVAESVHIGHGSVIFAGSVIQAGSTIGKGCIINTLSSVDHDCLIEDGVHVSPGVAIAGNVKIGKNTWIGIGSSVSPNLSIGADVVVAAGAVVISPVVSGTVVKGVPARA